jgi:hypothetical protein
VACFGLTGPYLFEDNAGAAVTVTSNRYVEMLHSFLEPELRCRGTDLCTIWFQQDGVTAHTASASMNVVPEMFPQHIISQYGDVQWPARSPDLSPCGYFLWGYLKSKVYSTRPMTIEDQKQRIRDEISAISEEMTRRVIGNLRG